MADACVRFETVDSDRKKKVQTSAFGCDSGDSFSWICGNGVPDRNGDYAN